MTDTTESKKIACEELIKIVEERIDEHKAKADEVFILWGKAKVLSEIFRDDERIKGIKLEDFGLYEPSSSIVPNAEEKEEKIKNYELLKIALEKKLDRIKGQLKAQKEK